MSTLSDLQEELRRAETMAAVGKIASNASYGKLGNKWSVLYSPELVIQVTLTGQLCLLMLIEMLEERGIPVVSANTDGIVVKCDRMAEDLFIATVKEWEKITGFETEATDYSSIHSRDVNSYCAVKLSGGVKTKGAFAIDPSTAIQKNPSNQVCTDAVIAYLTEGVMPEDTINACKDVRRFVTVRSVKGGAVTYVNEYLGRAARWYYALPDPEELVGTPCIRYRTNGNLVPRSEGAKPMMELPDELPSDLNVAWYVSESYAMLRSMGVKV